MAGEIEGGTLQSLDPTEVTVVDIRSRPAYDQGHLPESECIPFPELPDRITELDGAEHVVTVCPHGEASVKAARLISAYDGLADDARVDSLAGGLEAWDGNLVTED